MNNLNIEHAVEYVKTLVDYNRCVTCDKLYGPVVRYPCGHSVCENCVITAENCLLCLSPSNNSTNFTDEPYSHRIENVSRLLTTFQDLFKLDVYKRHRLSEQLKLEKLLFPKCIQAPLKYCNKRKRTKSVVKDKENISDTFLPIQSVSNNFKMEKTINYVQQWLNTNELCQKESNINLPRKAFADLNVNVQNFTKDCSLVSKDKNKIVPSRKRSHIKITNSSKKEKLKPLKKKKESIIEYRSLRNKENTNFQKNISENDESGIVIDDDIIVIDNSQREFIDKDKFALIAVKEAEKLNTCDLINCDHSKNEITTINNTKLTKPIHFEDIISSSYKIPFHKKSLLYQICNECTNERNIVQSDDNSKNVTITIDNNKFITTIKFSNSQVSNIETLNKQSVEIQTDIDFGKSDVIKTHIEHNTEVKNNYETMLSLPHQVNIKSPDLFNNDVGNENENNLKISKDTTSRDKCLVIEDSDKDSDINEKINTLEVIAEIHRTETFEDFGVLSSLESNEYENRMRPAVRGHTPLSTDSSDKENYDPNKVKRQRFAKKNYNKK